MLNTINVMGRLTRDPELRYTKNQVPVASFTIACDRDYANENTGRQTDFIDCIAWRGTGEFINKYFAKGTMICVRGRLEIRDWTDNNGNKRRNAEINVESAYFCESKRDQAEKKTPDPADYEGYTAPETPVNEFEELSDDGELPF